MAAKKRNSPERAAATEPPMGSEPTGEILLYETEDGRARVECRFAEDTLWLSQALMAELFQTTPQNITQHLKAILREGELREAATCKRLLQVRSEGKRFNQGTALKAVAARNAEGALEGTARRLAPPNDPGPPGRPARRKRR